MAMVTFMTHCVLLEGIVPYSVVEKPTATSLIACAGKCSGPQTVHDCKTTSEHCYYEIVGTEIDACVFHKRHFTNTGGRVTLNLDFNLQAGMDVVVKGPVPDIGVWVGAQFYSPNTGDNPRFGIDVDWNMGYCLINCLDSDANCNDPMPKVDFSWVTFTFRLTNTTSEIFVDERRVIQFPQLYRGNKMKFSGIGDAAHVLFVHTPSQL